MCLGDATGVDSNGDAGNSVTGGELLGQSHIASLQRGAEIALEMLQ